jgi:hypothetical protein
MIANVTKIGSTEQGIADGMYEHIAIGMSHTAPIIRDLDSSEEEIQTIL